MLVIFWVNTQTEKPKCRAEKASSTSWPVRPFTSFEAAQSSKIKSVLVPSKALVLYRVLLALYNVNPRVLGAETAMSPVVCECRTDQNNIIKLAAEWATSWATTNRDLPEFVGPTIRALNGVLLTRCSMTTLYKLCIVCSVLNIFQLSIRQTHLRVRQHKDMAVH